MLNNNDIEQQLREGFPFLKEGLFTSCEGLAYHLRSTQATIALYRHHPPETWGAKLSTEDNPYWTLAANEGSTPAIAIANLKQAIAQAAAFAEASASDKLDSLPLESWSYSPF